MFNVNLLKKWAFNKLTTCLHYELNIKNYYNPYLLLQHITICLTQNWYTHVQYGITLFVAAYYKCFLAYGFWILTLNKRKQIKKQNKS